MEEMNSSSSSKQLKEGRGSHTRLFVPYLGKSGSSRNDLQQTARSSVSAAAST